MLKDKSTIAAYLINRYVEYWLELGCSKDNLKGVFKEHYKHLSDNQYRVPSQYLARAYRSASKELSDPLLGVKSGLFHIPGTLGVIGTLTSTSKDIKMAICCGVRFFDILSQSYECTFHENSKGGTLRVFPIEGMDVSHHQIDAFLCTFIRLILFVCGKPSGTYCVTHTPNQDVQNQYRQLLNTDIKFGHDFNGFYFPKKTLEARVSYTGEEAHEQQVKIAYEQYENTQGVSDIIELLRRHIRHAYPDDKVSLESIAEQFYLTPRTLQNHLKRQNLSYSLLLKQEKIKIIETLVSKGKNASEISQILGYHDTSSFYRAFKSWVGQKFQSYFEI